jgi:hypothetical protein
VTPAASTNENAPQPLQRPGAIHSNRPDPMEPTTTPPAADSYAQFIAENDWAVFECILCDADKELPWHGPAYRWSWALSAFKSYKGRLPLFDAGHAWNHRRPAIVQMRRGSEPRLPVRPVADACEVIAAQPQALAQPTTAQE